MNAYNIKINIPKYKFNAQRPQVKLHEPTFGIKEIKKFTNVLASTNVTMGKYNKEFEKNYSKFNKSRYCVSNNSGSSANLLAISAITNPLYSKRLKVGDEVIVPALSWSTTIFPLIQCGLTPVLADVNPLTYNIDVQKIEKLISKKTKAIMLVHVYGNPCDMKEINRIVKKYNLILIEDSCESMGAKYNNKLVGSFGDIGTFSFYFSHHITTLEGGMCTTNSPEIYNLLKVLRSHGWARDLDNKKDLEKKFGIDARFLFLNLGYNLRITEPQAAFGIIQLKKLRQIIKKRQKLAQYWRKEMEKISDLLSFQETTKNAESSYFGFAINIKKNKIFDRSKFTRYLNQNGIETRPIICGNIAKQPVMKYYKYRSDKSLKFSTNIMNQSFSIGCHQSICDEAKWHVIKTFKNFFRKVC